MLAHARPGVDTSFAQHEDEPHLGVVPHLHIPFATYFGIVDELIMLLAEQSEPFDQVIAIMSGGFIPARAVATALGNLPLAYVASESYSSASGGRKMTADRDIRFDRHVLRAHPGMGHRILLIDDLDDSGRTFATWLDWFKRHAEFGGDDVHIATACLWHKATSTFKPDLWIDDVTAIPVPHENDHSKVPWIDQPLEYHYCIPPGHIRTRVSMRWQDHNLGESLTPLP